MILQNVLYNLVLSATFVSAFNLYKPTIKAPLAKSVANGGQGVDGGNEVKSEWKYLKPVVAPREANPFRPVGGHIGADLDSTTWQPVHTQPKEMKLKRVPQKRENLDLHPEIRSVQHANSVTKKYRKRGIPGPDIDRELALRNVLLSLQKRGLVKRQTYDILRSSEPTTPDSMAVHQDGEDIAYFSEIEFGSKRDPFLLIIDTGSSDTWIPSVNCTTPACKVHKTYGEKSSTTLKLTERKFSIQYGSGNVEGVVVSDDVAFAGFQLNIEFGLSTMVSDEFSYFPIDGIMGLGFSRGSAQRAKTIMDVLVEGKHIEAKLFSVAVSRAVDKLNDGVIHFGGVDKAYYSGDISFFPSISRYGLWELAVEDAAFGGKKYGFTGRTAIIDTGTTLVLLPPADAMRLHEIIDNAMTNGETFAVPCTTTQSMDFIFNGVSVSIPPKDWVGEAIGQGTDLCISMIMGRTIIDTKTWLVGDVFLKNVYAIFDMDNNRVGFAKRASPTVPNNKPSTTLTNQPKVLTPTSSNSPNGGGNGGNGNENGGEKTGPGGGLLFLAFVVGLIGL